MLQDESNIRKVVELYFESYLNADAEGIAEAFHEETRLLSVGEGSLEKTELSAWLPSLRTRREKGDIRRAETAIERVDVAGEAASVKARLRFAEFTFTDYLSLLKIGGAWRIVGKVYSRAP